MKHIPLINTEQVIQISDEDYLFCSQYNWRLNLSTGYIQGSNLDVHTKYLHKLIVFRVGVFDFEEIDHKDRNKLNNQRDNLDPTTIKKNRANSSPRRSGSGFKYIHLDKRTMLWQVRIKQLPIDIAGGTFDVLEDAIKARDRLIVSKQLQVYLE